MSETPTAVPSVCTNIAQKGKTPVSLIMLLGVLTGGGIAVVLEQQRMKASLKEMEDNIRKMKKEASLARSVRERSVSPSQSKEPEEEEEEEEASLVEVEEEEAAVVLEKNDGDIPEEDSDDESPP